MKRVESTSAPCDHSLLGCEHPLREDLVDEVHARPSDALDTPCRATFVAKLIDPGERARELRHLSVLCSLFSVEPPMPEANHFVAALGPLKLKWERHGEFSGYTFIAAGLSPKPFSEPPVLLLPPGWLAGLPGQVLVAAHAKIVAMPAEGVDAEFLARHFADNLVLGGDIGEHAGMAYTDFRVHADGFSRFLLIDKAFTVRQAGRMLQRLFEIETYRMMALLALPVARQQSTRLVDIGTALASVTTDIASGSVDDEALLHKVTRLAAEVESGLAASQFRFGACRAYGELVATRIAELREARQPGIQPIGEFMTRRFTPAVATCAAVSQRLRDLSERVARASALLSTRVDIARERQNQALLASMDRRAKAQLRLQQAVEGLSVAAIVYYAAGLVGYLTKGLKSAGVHVEPDLLIGASIPLLFVMVFIVTRRARRRLTRNDRLHPADEAS
ncbi:MAG: DUF3422 domain-containing protein [Burkholderiaceae bacterium]